MPLADPRVMPSRAVISARPRNTYVGVAHGPFKPLEQYFSELGVLCDFHLIEAAGMQVAVDYRSYRLVSSKSLRSRGATFAGSGPRLSVQEEKQAELSTTFNYEQWMQEHFALIGRGDGVYATPEGRRAEYQAWKSFGQGGAWWLIDRLATASETRQLWGVSNILSAMSPTSIRPILSTLEGKPSVEQADVLLSALAGMPREVVEVETGCILPVLERYLAHEDESVRLQAVSATAALEPTLATSLLQDALAWEQDEDVRAMINETLELGSRQ